MGSSHLFNSRATESAYSLAVGIIQSWYGTRKLIRQMGFFLTRQRIRMHSELVAMFPAVVYHSSLANVRKMTALRPGTCIVKLYLQASRRVIAIRYHERAR
jgi:hypothetical protein